MKAYIERRFSDGEPEDRKKTYLAKSGDNNGYLAYMEGVYPWTFWCEKSYISIFTSDHKELIYLEPTTIDSDLYQKANPTDHAEFVHHIAQEVASAIWESTGKGNSHFNQVDINHIAEICAEEIVRAKAR